MAKRRKGSTKHSDKKAPKRAAHRPRATPPKTSVLKPELVAPKKSKKIDIDGAQEIAWEAIDALDDTVEARRLAGLARTLDPDCPDALYVLARTNDGDLAEAVELLNRAVDVAAERLGPELFEQGKGNFWLITETRPYMRLRYELASCLRDQGCAAEAIGHFEELIELCPGDNMGVRYTLTETLLMADQVERARDLVAAYEEDGSVTLGWFRALIHYRLRDWDRAEEALQEAQARNPHVAKYVLELRPFDDPPTMYELGSEEEAMAAAEHLVDPWSACPMAAAWALSGQRPDSPGYAGLYALDDLLPPGLEDEINDLLEAGWPDDLPETLH